MNLPKEFPELKALLEKMSAPFRKFEPLIEIQGSVRVTPDEYDVIDEVIPIVQNRKAVLYLEDAWKIYRQYNDYPKYHVLHCRTLQKMQRYGRYANYHASTRTDGRFLVKLSADEERSLFELDLCRNCLNMLKEQYGTDVFPNDPKEFPLADWFETIENAEEFDQINRSDGSFDYLSNGWKDRSLTCRENASWTCQQCNVNLETDRHLLHAHHQWGTQYNDPEDLIALCIDCHSQQSGGGHKILATYPQHQEFMKKYRNVHDRIHQSDLSNIPNPPISEENTVSSLPANVIEKDIPF